MYVLDLGTYAYFYGSLIGLIITAIIYFLHIDLRKSIIINGLGVAFLGVVLEVFFFKDYWTPPLLIQFGKFGGIEDLMFGFAAGGIGSTLPSLVFKFKNKNIIIHSIIYLYFITLLIQILLIVIAQKVGINSIYASSLGFFATSMIIFLTNKKLVIKQVFGGLIGATILGIGEGLILRLFANHYLDKYFLLYKDVFVINDFLIVSELLWGFCFGMFISTISDYHRNLQI